MSETNGSIDETVWCQIRDGLFTWNGEDGYALAEKIASAWPATADRLLHEFTSNVKQIMGAVDIITGRVLRACDRMGKLSDDEARQFAVRCFELAVDSDKPGPCSVGSTLEALRGRASNVVAQMAGLTDHIDDDLMKLKVNVFAKTGPSWILPPTSELLDDLLGCRIREEQRDKEKIWVFDSWIKLAPWAYDPVARCLERTVVASTFSRFVAPAFAREEIMRSVLNAADSIHRSLDAHASCWSTEQIKAVAIVANNLVIFAKEVKEDKAPEVSKAQRQAPLFSPEVSNTLLKSPLK